MALRTVFGSFVVFCLAGGLLAQSGMTSDHCSDVLHLDFRESFVDAYSLHEEELYRLWACNASESDVEDSLKAGLKVPIKGIPIGVDADRNSVDQWKSTECSDTTKAQKVDKKILHQQETVSQQMSTAIKAWSACMDSARNANNSKEPPSIAIGIMPDDHYDKNGIFTISVHGTSGVREPPSLKLLASGADCNPHKDKWISSDKIRESESWSCTRPHSQKDDRTCPKFSKKNPGFDRLSLNANWAYSLWERLDPFTMSIAEYPEIPTSCTCASAGGLEPNFDSDPLNCGRCGQQCGGSEDAASSYGSCRAGACTKCVFPGPTSIKGNESFPIDGCFVGVGAKARISVSGDVGVKRAPQDANREPLVAHAYLYGNTGAYG